MYRSSSAAGAPTPGGGRATPGRNKRQHHRNDDSSPIEDFTTLIETTKSDAWQRRITCFEALVTSIPTGSEYLESSSRWYNTPKILGHLYRPVSTLLKDARSTVVRRTCDTTIQLFLKTQMDGRVLFKNLMSCIIQVHAQTVQVIRTAVQNLVVTSIRHVPCKSIMPYWMERLKDKSPAVRDACSIYLGLALQHWDSVGGSDTTSSGYLTDEIWNQVSMSLLQTLRDPTPSVRAHGKETLLFIRQSHPTRWVKLITNESLCHKDPKLIQWLQSVSSNHNTTVVADAENADELSVASKYTYNSDSRFFLSGRPRISSPQTKVNSSNVSNNNTMSYANNYTNTSTNNTIASSKGTFASGRITSNTNMNPDPMTVPVSIAVKTSPSQQYSSSSPTKQQHSPSKQYNTSSPSKYTSPPRRIRTPNSSAAATPSPTARIYTALAVAASSPQQQNHVVHSTNNHTNTDTTTELLEYSESSTTNHNNNTDTDIVMNNNTPSRRYRSVDVLNSNSFNSDDGHNDDNESTSSPFIVSLNELKLHASQRRSRKSIELEERFAAATNDEAEQEVNTTSNKNNIHHNSNDNANTNINNTATTATSVVPNHMVVAIRLLRAHKSHVDAIMGTLKLEMDTLRDFDKLLELPGRPTPTELVNYYESIELCVNQRLSYCNVLQKETNDMM